MEGYPYKTKTAVAEALGISKSTVHVRAEEMAHSGRYGDFCIIQDGNLVLINALCFLDWLRYRRELMDSNLKKRVPDFRPVEIATEMGWKVPTLKSWRVIK